MSYRNKHVYSRIRKARSKRLTQRPLFWIGITFLILCGIITYFLFLFPGFHILQVSISGNQEVPASAIETEVYKYLNRGLISLGFIKIPSQSFFVTNKEAISKNLIKEFPYIESVNIKKEFPHHISILIQERQPFANLCYQEQCFLIDSNGVIFKNLEVKNESMLQLTFNKEEVTLGQNVIGKEEIEIIQKIQKNLFDNFHIEIKEVFVANPMVFKTAEGWKAYFNPAESVDLQITKINSLLEKEITLAERQNLQYIYLQYEDKAYYQ